MIEFVFGMIVGAAVATVAIVGTVGYVDYLSGHRISAYLKLLLDESEADKTTNL